MKKGKFLFLLLFVFVLSSCGKSGSKSVEKLNHELKNSSVQFSLSPEEINILRKSYKEFTDEEKNIFSKILKKYDSFKEKNKDVKLNFENDILRIKQEELNVINNNDIDFKKEASKDIKLEEKILKQNSTTDFKDLDISEGSYIVKLTGKGKFTYHDENEIVSTFDVSEENNPKYIRIVVSEKTKLELNGDLNGKIFKDNIKYDHFKILPMGYFIVGKDFKAGNYKIKTKNKDTLVYKIRVDKNKKLEKTEIKDYENVELFENSRLLILGTNYVEIERMK